MQPVVPISGKVRRRQTRTRDLLLRESARLFVTKGYENVSVEDILAASGIARSSFYRFFANREDVLASIIRPVFERGNRELSSVSGASGRELIAGVLQVYLTLWSEGPDALRASTRFGGVYFSLFEDVHREFRQRLQALVERAGAEGVLLNDSSDYSARLIARVAVPTLEVYASDPDRERLFMETMAGLLMKPEVNK